RARRCGRADGRPRRDGAGAGHATRSRRQSGAAARRRKHGEAQDRAAAPNPHEPAARLTRCDDSAIGAERGRRDVSAPIASGKDMRFGPFAPLMLALAPYLAAAPAPAHEFHRLGDIVIEQPWSRATPVKVGTAYMTLRNNGTTSDRLIKVSSPMAEQGEVHETKVDDGTAMMRPMGALELKPRSSVQLKPGGIHVMLTGLARPLKEGERVKLSLTFEKAGTIDIEARVEKAGAVAPGEHSH